jgi:hypothetical protein
MIALSVATTAASIVGEVQAAKSQTAAIHEQLAEVTQQVDQKAGAEINERQRAARREQGRMKVAAGEAGLQLGGSIDLLLKDSAMQAGLSEERTLDNRNNDIIAANREATSALSKVESPTILGAGLRLASSAAQGYSAGNSMVISRNAAEIAAGQRAARNG